MNDPKETYLPFFDVADAINIRDYRSATWHTLSSTEQGQWIDEVFDYYRNTYGFPYFDLSDSDVHSALWRLRTRKPKWEGDMVLWDNTAVALSAHFFPHIWGVQFRSKRTPLDAFESDKFLRDAIHLAFKIKPTVSPADLLGAFCLGTAANVGVVSRFKPMAAKAIWERYAPEGGVCYDYACGWGGRLMGCAASQKNLHYIGVDPEPRTFKCLNILAQKIHDTYGCHDTIVQAGSEVFCPSDLQGLVDVAFSSPPYFDLEKYSGDDTQSHVKYPTLQEWLDGFVVDTFTNVRTLLKPGGVLGLNLVDFDGNDLCAQTVARIKDLGFEEVETLHIQMAQRRGQGQDTTSAYKSEPVFVFRRP